VDDDAIVEIPVTNDNEDEALVKECEDCTFWMNHPVDWKIFLTDTSSKANHEDPKKELQTIHG
jgi:hypothetical protein